MIGRTVLRHCLVVARARQPAALLRGFLADSRLVRGLSSCRLTAAPYRPQGPYPGHGDPADLIVQDPAGIRLPRIGGKGGRLEAAA